MTNTDKSKFTYNGRGLAFDGKGLLSFDNDTTRNVVIVGVDNSSSSDNDNPKYIVKPLYSRDLRFLKKVSGIRRCLLYRVLNFFEEKIIIDENITIFYVNCDSLQLHFLKKTYGQYFF